MRPQGSARIALVLIASSSFACSLVKLSDEIEQGRCQSQTDCDVLNTESVLDEDACTRWHCEQSSGLCTYRALDLDDDGQSPASVEHDGETFMCESAAARQDCNDNDPETRTGAMERCDGDDNDCDGRIDEGALRPRAAPLVTVDEGLQVTQASYGLDPGTGRLAIAYGLLDNTNPQPGLSLVDAALEERTAAAAVRAGGNNPPQGEQVAVAAARGQFVYAYVHLDGTPRMVAGLADAAGERIAVDETIAEYGVSCQPSEACAENAGHPEVAVAIPGTIAPALGALDGNVLLAYLRYDGDAEPQCGSLRDAGEQPDLLAHWLALSGNNQSVTEESTEPLVLGKAADVAPPAIVAVGEIGTRGGTVGWLVGHIDAERRAVIDRVEVVDGALEVTEPAVIAIGDGVEPRSSVALALGPSSGGMQVMAVASQRGCDTDARVTVDLYGLQLDEDGALEVTTIAEGIEAGGDDRQTSPALAYSAAAERAMWAVVYRDASGLRARLFDREGRLQDADAEPYTLIASQSGDDGSEVRVLLAPTVLAAPEAGDDWFGAVAHVLRTDESSERAFEAVRLGCAP